MELVRCPVFFSLVLPFLTLIGTTAEATPREERVVGEVVVRGNVRVETAAIEGAIDIHAGERMTPEAVAGAIRDVYRLGTFRDVVVSGETVGNSVTLIIEVVEKPSVREVIFEGQQKVPIDDITEAVTLQSYTILDEADVRANQHSIEEVYLDRGFYLVEVSTELRDTADNQVDVIYTIHEGRKVLVKQIDVVGNAAFSDTRLKSFMTTKEAGLFPGAGKTGTYRESQLEDDVEQLTAFYVEFGYLDVRVGRPRVTLTPDRRWLLITIAVEEGDPYSIGDVFVDGDLFYPEDELLGLVRVQSGEPWRRSRLMTDQRALTDCYADDGYAFAHVIPVPTTDPQRNVAHLRFMIRAGNLITLDRVRITGNDSTWDKVIRREIGIDEGEIWRGSELRRTRARLQRLGFFEDVQITTPRGDSPDTMDLLIDVTERPSRTVNVGAGFSTTENFTLTANFSQGNFLGLGYFMTLNANLSLGSDLSEGTLFGENSRQQLQGVFYDPYFLDTRATFRFSGYSQIVDYGLRESRQGFSLALGHHLGRNDEAEVSLEYRLDNQQLTSLSESQKNFLGGRFYRGGITSALKASLVLDRRNDRLNTTKGVYASGSAELAGGFRVNDEEVLDLLGGDFRYLRFQGNVRVYLPLGTPLVVARWNLSLGYVTSLDGTVVPYSIRYRAGGVNSLRGFAPYSVGPYQQWLPNDDPVHAADGTVIGGNASVVSNLELQFPLVPPAGVSGVFFFDAGDAFGGLYGSDPFSPENLRLSIGFGARWNSPMGPLRFEWGFPINRRPGEREMVFELGMGTFF